MIKGVLMADKLGINTTVKQADTMSRDMEKDLEAVFNVMKDDVLALVQDADKEGWTPDQLIKKVEALI